MVLQITRYDVQPDKVDAYTKWAQGAIKAMTEAPGHVAFRAYRSRAGGSQVMTMTEFADLATWSSDDEGKRVVDELRAFTSHVDIELWETSPLMP